VVGASNDPGAPQPQLNAQLAQPPRSTAHDFGSLLDPRAGGQLAVHVRPSSLLALIRAVWPSNVAAYKVLPSAEKVTADVP